MWAPRPTDLEVGEVAADERVEGGGLSAVFDGERGEGGAGVVSAATDAPVAAAGPFGGGDGELPDAGADLPDAAGTSGLASGWLSGWGWGSPPSAPAEPEMLGADTRGSASHAATVTFGARGPRASSQATRRAVVRRPSTLIWGVPSRSQVPSQR